VKEDDFSDVPMPPPLEVPGIDATKEETEA